MGVPTDIPMLVSMVDTEPMVPTPLPMDMATEPMEPTPTLTMERGLLMLSLRLMLRLTLPSSMVPMDIPMPVSMVDTEPMVPTPLPMDMDTEPMEPTPILTTERGLLMLSLTPPSFMELMAMLVCPMPAMLPTELTPMLMVSPLDPALVRTPSPRDSTP